MLDPQLEAARARLLNVYDPTAFAAAGRECLAALSEHYAKVGNRETAVLPWRSPPELAAAAEARLKAAPAELPPSDAHLGAFRELLETVLSHGINLHHPRYVGHQVPPPVPWAGWFDAVGGMTNQPMAVHEMGPWATAAETALVRELGGRLWPAETFAGFLTHGGSIANLTALLAARNRRFPGIWEDGLPRQGRPPVLLVQGDAHYCIARSAGILGLGTKSVRRIGLDAARRLDPRALEELLETCRREETPVVAVVACAGATPTGAFDPLDEVADLCRRYEVRLHVDAAHGGAVLLSRRHRPLVAGLEKCDSFVWDAHKMLFVPALAAFVFYRDRADRFEAFRQDAPYLFDPSAPGLAEFDLGLQTLECTKRATSYGLWGLWSLFGPSLFEDLVDCTFDLARGFAEHLRGLPDFDVRNHPQSNILVFRHLPAGLRDAPAEVVGKFQLALRRRIIESGAFYLVQTTLDGLPCLRMTLMNARTTAGDLLDLVATLRHTGEGLLREMK